MEDNLKDKVLKFIKLTGEVNTISIQREFKIGYSTVCKIIDWAVSEKQLAPATCYKILPKLYEDNKL